jgi:hypothetical protein
MATKQSTNYTYSTKTPSVRTESQTVVAPWSAGGNYELNRQVVDKPTAVTHGWWDDVIAGSEEQSAALTDKLKSIYDGFEGYATEFGGKIEPIMDALNGDIGKMEQWMEGYQGLLTEIKPTMMHGLQIDPTAAGYRAEYMGNVGAQYDQAQEQMNRQMAQQGINPYSNTGATRDMALNRAGAVAGAANQAYANWRQDYNTNMQAQQDAMAKYAGLYGKTGDYFGDILKARSGMADTYRGLYDSRLQAQIAKAQGYEGLLGLEFQKWQTGLQGAQQQSMINQQNAAMASQMQMGLGAAGEWHGTPTAHSTGLNSGNLQAPVLNKTFSA